MKPCAARTDAQRQALAAAVLAALLTAGCATPAVMLKNESNGQVARCGGGSTGSVAGGLIGYNIEKSADEQCVRDFEAKGFKRAPAPP